MGDRHQQAQSGANELKGRANQEAGVATDKPTIGLRGAREVLNGKAENAAGEAHSILKATG